MILKLSTSSIKIYIKDTHALLDEIYGPGFASNNPEIVQRYVDAAVRQYIGDVLAEAVTAIKAAFKLDSNSQG